MSRSWVVILVALVGCRGDSTRTKRTGSAAPVEMITQPQLGDGGMAGTGAITDEIEPNDGFYVDSLGWVFYQRGDYPQAVEQL